MNHFNAPLSTASVSIGHSSPSASTVCAGTGFTHLSFAHTCKNFVAARRVNSEVGLRLQAVLALAVVCGASLCFASSASAQTNNGIVTAWGSNANGYGQCTIPDSANSGVSAIAGGDQHTIALTDGAVLAWGYNGYGQCDIPDSAISGVSAIAGGAYHTIALTAGTVLAWGYNYYGQCNIPADANSGVSAIAGGY